jgi:hypothetical protein
MKMASLNVFGPWVAMAPPVSRLSLPFNRFNQFPGETSYNTHLLWKII